MSSLDELRSLRDEIARTSEGRRESWMSTIDDACAKLERQLASERQAFAALWDEINGERAAWSSNPWVWALTFSPVEMP